MTTVKKEWYKNVDLPAVISARGDLEYYENGKRHRDNGPAVIRKDGVCSWYKHGIHLVTCNVLTSFFKSTFKEILTKYQVTHTLSCELSAVCSVVACGLFSPVFATGGTRSYFFLRSVPHANWTFPSIPSGSLETWTPNRNLCLVFTSSLYSSRSLFSVEFLQPMFTRFSLTNSHTRASALDYSSDVSSGKHRQMPFHTSCNNISFPLNS